MEEQKQGIVKSAETRLPKFVEDAYESVEKMERFAEILLNSKLVPNHFYEKLPDGKPDFTKGKTPAVVAVLIQGYQLQLPPLTALQHIIPVNGLLSIKGDLAKSMIFNSGKLKSGSWVEEEIGSIDEGNLVVKITATRSDNGQTLSRSFSIAQAKRAGLWITEQQVNGQDGWKYKSSAWWKYPSRMINYRALGFLARDMFPDVMAGIYTTEEAMDLPKDVTEVIETESGAKITIPDKEHAKGRSAKMTDRVVDKIPDNKFGEVKKDNIAEAEVINDTMNVPDPPRKNDQAILAGKGEELVKELENTETPFIPSKGSVEFLDGKEIKRDDAVVQPAGLDELEKKETKELLKIVNDDMDMMESSEMIGGKNTKKKLAAIIFAHQNNELAEYTAKNMPKENTGDAPGSTDEGPVHVDGPISEPNREFDSQGPKKTGQPADLLIADKKAGNKYDMVVPEYDKGSQREFSTTKTLFNKMMGVTPQITTPRYLELGAKLNFLTKYKDKEIFCRDATVEEICELLNAN